MTIGDAIRAASVTVTLVLVAGDATGLAAQTIRGRVTDESVGGPIALAQIRLLDRDGDRIAVALADSTGLYELTAPEPGEYRVEADMLGYQTLSSPLLSLPVDRTVVADFELPPSPIELEGLRVEAEAREQIRRDLRMFGVRLDDLGARFVDRDAIEQRATASDFGTVLQWQNVPNMSILRSDDASPPPPYPDVCVRLVRGRDGCALTVLDGARVTRAVAASIPPELLRAMVVLRPQEATLLYGTDGGVGAILLFTRGYSR